MDGHISLGVPDAECLLQLLPPLLDLGVEVATDRLLSPGLVVKLCSSLFFWVSYHICHRLEVSALGLQPVVDKALRISGKTQHELSLGLQLVNGLNGFMDLVVQSCYFLLTGCGQQEGVHLGLQCVVHFYVNVIAGSLLLVIRVHTDHMVDDDGLWGHQECMQALRDLRKLHSLSLKDLLQVFVTVNELALMRILEFVGLDVLPQGLNDDRSGLGVDTQHSSQPGVQLELRGLVVKHEQDGAANTHITRPLHLEPISLLGGGSPVPLKGHFNNKTHRSIN